MLHPGFCTTQRDLMEDWPMVRWIFLLMVDLGEDVTRNSVLGSLIFSLFLSSMIECPICMIRFSKGTMQSPEC